MSPTLKKLWEAMRIAVCGSVEFAGKINEIGTRLERMGHEPVLPKSVIEHGLKNIADAERLKGRDDYITEIKPRYTHEHFNQIKDSDAILVVNMDKKGPNYSDQKVGGVIRNYIGGATFAEIMLAFHYGKKIFLLNPLPTDRRLEPYIDELRAVKPVVLNGNLGLVK